MGTESTKVVLDLDNAEFVSKMKETMGLMDEFGKAENLANLVTKLGELGAIAAVLYVSYQALKGAIDFVEQAEQIEQVNAAFNDMATSAGLAADVLKNQLVTAAAGLVSETDLLKSANKEIVKMGENASKLPQIMELARKSTALFGGDLLTNFENISNAMNNGNVRMLRSQGIIVDTDVATKKYANSLGIGTEFLSQAGKKQAIFNEALEVAQNKFKDVNVNITETSNNFQKMSASLTEIKEAAALAWESLAGGSVKKLTGQLADSIHGLAVNMKAAFGHGEEQANAKKEALEREIAQYKVMLEQTNKLFNPGQYAEYDRHLRSIENQLQRINDQEEHALMLKMKQEGAGVGKDKAEPMKPSQEDLDKMKEARRKFENDILTLRKERQKAEEGVETNAEALDKIYKAEAIRITEAAEQKKLEIKKLYDGDAKTKGVISKKQFADAEEEIERKKLADIKAMNNKFYEEKATAAKHQLEQDKYTASGFSAGWKSAAADATLANKNFGEMGKKTFDAVNKNAAAAFKAMGDGSKNAGEAMKSFMFGALGDIATAKGEVMLADGIGSFNPIQIAEGGALLALGSALSAMGSGGGSSVSGGGGGSGGGSSTSPSSGDSGSLTPGPAAAPQKKSVNVQIMGHYFETEQTRTKMMDMIRQAGDFTDFNLKQIGQP